MTLTNEEILDIINSSKTAKFNKIKFYVMPLRLDLDYNTTIVQLIDKPNELNTPNRIWYAIIICSKLYSLEQMDDTILFTEGYTVNKITKKVSDPKSYIEYKFYSLFSKLKKIENIISK